MDLNSVYVERKTHHEKWTQQRSQKERFPLRPDAVPSLLRGTCDINAEARSTSLSVMMTQR